MVGGRPRRARGRDGRGIELSLPEASGLLLPLVGPAAAQSVDVPATARWLGAHLGVPDELVAETPPLAALAAALVALLFAGGGKWGFDAGRKWAAAPKWSGFAGIIVAAVYLQDSRRRT